MGCTASMSAPSAERTAEDADDVVQHRQLLLPADVPAKLAGVLDGEAGLIGQTLHARLVQLGEGAGS